MGWDRAIPPGLGLADRILQIVNDYMERRRKASENQDKLILAALESLDELIKLHLKEIDMVVEPILQNGENGFLTTCDNYLELVDNKDLPLQYGRIRGELEGVRYYKKFRKDMNLGKCLEAVLDELGMFQYAAFTLYKPDLDADSITFLSAKVARVSFENAKRLWLLPPDSASSQPDLVKGLVTQIHDGFDMYRWFDEERAYLESLGKTLNEPIISRKDYDIALNSSQLGSHEGLIRIVSMWCRIWKDHVKQHFWGSNIMTAIGQLKAALAAA